MRRPARSFLACLAALGVAFATLGAATGVCAGTVRHAAPSHECEGGSERPPAAPHDDCSMMASSCAVTLVDAAAADASPTGHRPHALPAALDDARPSGIVAAPTPPPPRA